MIPRFDEYLYYDFEIIFSRSFPIFCIKFERNLFGKIHLRDGNWWHNKHKLSTDCSKYKIVAKSLISGNGEKDSPFPLFLFMWMTKIGKLVNSRRQVVLFINCIAHPQTTRVAFTGLCRFGSPRFPLFCFRCFAFFFFHLHLDWMKNVQVATLRLYNCQLCIQIQSNSENRQLIEIMARQRLFIERGHIRWHERQQKTVEFNEWWRLHFHAFSTFSSSPWIKF